MGRKKSDGVGGVDATELTFLVELASQSTDGGADSRGPLLVVAASAFGGGAAGDLFRAARRVAEPQSDALPLVLKCARPGAGALALAAEARWAARAFSPYFPVPEALTSVVRSTHPAIPVGTAVLLRRYVPGGTLSTFDLQRFENKEEFSAALLGQLGRALASLHGAGLRHGDVKPANILVSEDSGPPPKAPRFALVDLGLTAPFGAPLDGGTPAFLPRPLPAAPAADADLFALGLVVASCIDAHVGEVLTRTGDPEIAVKAWFSVERATEPLALAVSLLLAAEPSQRPSAASLAARFAPFGPSAGLTTTDDPDRVARAWLSFAARALDRRPALALTGRPRVWAERYLRSIPALDESLESQDASNKEYRGLSVRDRGRWMLASLGRAALHRGLLGDRFEDDAALADWLVEAANTRTGESDEGGPEAGDGSRGVDQNDVSLLAVALAGPSPSPAELVAARDAIFAGKGSGGLRRLAARALARRNGLDEDALLLLGDAPSERLFRAELLRRAGAIQAAETAIHTVIESEDMSVENRAFAEAIRGRIAFDRGDPVGVQAALAVLPARASNLVGYVYFACSELRLLEAWRRGDLDAAARARDALLAAARDSDEETRAEGLAGMVAHAGGDAASARDHFREAASRAARFRAPRDEAVWLVGLAASAAEAGLGAEAVAAGERASALFEALARPADAARSLLAVATAWLAVGAVTEGGEAAAEARRLALQGGDRLCAAFAAVAAAEAASRDPRECAEGRAEAGEPLRADVVRASPPQILTILETSFRDAATPLRWEILQQALAAADELGRDLRSGETPGGDKPIGDVENLLETRLISAIFGALAEVPRDAGVALRARVLFGAARLAEARDDGARSAAWDAERAPLAALLTAHAPAGRYDPAAAPWLVAPRTLAQKAGDAAVSIGRLDAFAQIVRLLEGAGSLRELLGRVLDALLLWTRAERGAVLLPAPDDRLVARVRRHLDLGQGTQQALSYGLARRAIAQGDVVVATDAFADLGNLHASVHALRLRSVLAVPLLARGRTYGVVYLDDKRQKQLFGPEEIAWVRLLATQAALAVADAHERAVLARAHRRAEKRGSALSALVAAKDEALRAAEAAVAAARGDEEGALIGTSRPMQALRARLRRVAAAEIPVLILGESGTGKELVARGVHDGSPRRLRPFVSENCGAIPEGLLESTLFGHIRGAFTGATANRPGLFERADGGTLFLDEIAELPLAMQAKLLRVLQDGEVRPVGSDRSRRVNVRLVAATHRDLPARVAAGLFREDLLYRIDVVRLDVPPLRERLDDVPLLVAHFLAKYQQPGETPRAITTTALAALARRAWPGNVRQLENDVRRLLVLADATITLDALGEEPPPSSLGPQAAPHPATLPGEDLDLRGRVDDLERVLVAEALRRTAGNQTRAALLLGVSRFGLQKMQKRLGF